MVSPVLPDTGNYSRLSVEILFTRSCGYYLLQVYLPAALIVVFSWSSFWLDRGDTDRGATLLAMTMLIVTTNGSLPKISYFKAIDVYLSACFIMVFASLSGINLQLCVQLNACTYTQNTPEFVTVSYMAKQIQMRKNSLVEGQKSQKAELSNNDGDTCHRLQTQESVNPIPRVPEPQRHPDKMMGVSPSDIDKWSRIIFPATFAAFNLLYWPLYSHLSNETVDDLLPPTHFKPPVAAGP